MEEKDRLPEGEVHAWRIDLRTWHFCSEKLASLLDPAERERAARFRFDHLARAFTIARARQRTILARYLGEDPGRVRFSTGPRGKPEVAAPISSPPVRFNLSHSGDYVLLAAVRDRRIGVDVEHAVREIDEMDDIARQNFSARERAAWDTIEGEDRRQAFYLCWTRKEAFIKAVGEGLSMPLDSFDVELRPGVPAALTAIGGDANEASRWSLTGLDVAPGYAAALCLEGGALPIRTFEDIP